MKIIDPITSEEAHKIVIVIDTLEYDENEDVIREYELRRKLGCYTRCTIANSSCHFTCLDYKEEVLPYIKKGK